MSLLLGFGQSAKPEKAEFFAVVWELFRPFCTHTLTPATHTWYEPRQDAWYTKIYFVTMLLPCFNQIHTLFYVAPE